MSWDIASSATLSVFESSGSSFSLSCLAAFGARQRSRGAEPGKNLFAAGPRAFSEVLPKMQRTVPRVEWCNPVSPSQNMVGNLPQNWCCKECFGVFASTASNLANEAGGWVLFFKHAKWLHASVDASIIISNYQHLQGRMKRCFRRLSQFKLPHFCFPKFCRDRRICRFGAIFGNFIKSWPCLGWNVWDADSELWRFLCVSTGYCSPALATRIATWLILPVYEMRTKELALQLLVLLAGRRRTLAYCCHIEAVHPEKESHVPIIWCCCFGKSKDRLILLGWWVMGKKTVQNVSKWTTKDDEIQGRHRQMTSSWSDAEKGRTDWSQWSQKKLGNHFSSFFFLILSFPCIIFRFSDGMLRFHIWCLRRTDECCRLLPVLGWGHRALQFQPMFAPSWMNIVKAGRCWKQCFYVLDCLCMLRIQTLMVIKAWI